jgi:2-polyprenyl-3-methyl-5-hydroxy-6-metoxy-1,4-benzoquinol methylase
MVDRPEDGRSGVPQEIYESEREFFDAHADEEIEERYRGSLQIVPAEHLAALRLFRLEGDLEGKRVVDCACGTGFLSVLLALRGARVDSFDLSPRCVEFTKRRAAENGVADRVNTVVAAFETVGFPAGTYDLVVGKNVLHHIPKIEDAGRVIHRLLKPGGRGIFYELSANNPILMFFRDHVIGKTRAIPKLGTPDEHPITRDEVERLSGIFGGKIEVDYPKFRFFGKLDRQVFHRRWRLLSRICDGLDDLIFRYAPPLRQYSYKILLVMEK